MGLEVLESAGTGVSEETSARLDAAVLMLCTSKTTYIVTQLTLSLLATTTTLYLIRLFTTYEMKLKYLQ